MRRTRRIRRVVSGQANRRRQNAFACLCWLSSRTISPQPDHDLAGLLRSNLVPTQQIFFLVLRCHRLLPAYGHTTGLPRAIELAILAGRGQKRAHSCNSGDRTSLAGHRERRPTPGRLPSQRIPITFFEPADTTVHVHSVPSVEDARHRTANGIECRLLYQVFAGTAARLVVFRGFSHSSKFLGHHPYFC